MRILFVCTDAEIGGAERFLASLAGAKRAEDTAGLVILMKPGSLSPQLEKSFDEVHYLGFTATSRNVFSMVHALEQVSRAFAPDIVSSHLFHADLVTMLAKLDVPKTTTIHTQGFGEGDHHLTRLIARTVGFFSNRFAAVIPASSSEQMTSFLRQLKMKNVAASITNCADVPTGSAFDTSSRTFISLARNHPVKGHKFLFEAFASIAQKHENWRLAAYGTDVTLDDHRMKLAIESANATHLIANGRIVLGGPLEHPEIPLAAASALVISSVHGEAFPIVGVEAAGLGIPVITTDLGSCAEFVDDKRFLVKPASWEGLAEAMDAYAALSNAERTDLSLKARKRAEASYHPKISYERYRDVFSRSILGRKT